MYFKTIYLVDLDASLVGGENEAIVVLEGLETLDLVVTVGLYLEHG